MAISPPPYLVDTHSCPDCWRNGGPGHNPVVIGARVSTVRDALTSSNHHTRR